MLSQAGLTVYFDFKSPNSYLALAGLLAAKNEGIKLQWHPFDHKPLKKPAQQNSEEDRSTRHRRIRGEYLATELQRYAPHPLRDPYLATNCDIANMGVLWLQEHAPTLVDNYVESVFLALWRDHADVELPQVIAGLLNTVMGKIAFDAGAWDVYVRGLDRRRWRKRMLGPRIRAYLSRLPFFGRRTLSRSCPVALGAGANACWHLNCVWKSLSH